ncbi:rhamnogalacturonan acetylesterase [Dysgonomonas capnocytophagoides]|uniref:rhamnogalacturonan acetylesterase n=1 Tax=Dysgonomonas capnocytophagoides TaxID=45254 RepID=UPI00333FDA20
MKRIQLIVLLIITCISGTAASGKYVCVFDFTGAKLGQKEPVNKSTIYGLNSGFGYDLGTGQKDGEPFFFSVDVPEGNYRVTVTLGDKDAESCTTVKSESRRLMLENITTAKGKYKTYTFTVNVRNTKIGETDSVRIKPREVGKLIWDNKLTLEFNGDNPSVTQIKIEKVDNLVTLFLAGDSTVVDEANEPWSGWGQLLPRFLSSDIAVANYAESGEAANSFVSSKRFAKLLSEMKAGDYLFIQFGHNDQKQKGEGKGPYASYTRDLKYLIDEARAKGGIPVLITSMNRRTFDSEGKITNSHGDYPDAVRKLAKQENVALIDLNAMSKTLYEAWGDEGSKKAFVHFPAGTFPDQDKDLADNTHFNPYGGYELAKCIIQGIIDNNIPVKKYIVKDFKGFDPAHPDAFDSVRIPRSPLYSMVKPDGN